MTSVLIFLFCNRGIVAQPFRRAFLSYHIEARGPEAIRIDARQGLWPGRYCVSSWYLRERESEREYVIWIHRLGTYSLPFLVSFVFKGLPWGRQGPSKVLRFQGWLSAPLIAFPRFYFSSSASCTAPFILWKYRSGPICMLYPGGRECNFSQHWRQLPRLEYTTWSVRLEAETLGW